MDRQYTGKCNEIFEREREIQDIEPELEQLQEYFDLEVPAEYQYILERHTGIYIREDYGFKSLEKTPLTDENGFDTMSFFFPLKDRNSIFAVYEMYKQQLPVGLIPVGELDGGNLLCLNRVTNGIYVWIHDEEGRNTHLAQSSMYDFILSFRKTEHEKNADLGIVKAEFSPGFLEALRNYKKGGSQGDGS